MVKSIKKNYLYNLAFQVLKIILPIITAPYLARVLGVSGVGISSYTLSIVAYYILVANIGVSAFGTREIAMHRDDKKKMSKIFWDLFAYQLITGLITTLAYLGLILFANEYQIIYGILIINLIGSVIDISWIYEGLEEYKFISIRNIIIKLLFTVSIFLFVKTPDDLNLFMLLNGLSIFVSSLAVWTKLKDVVDKPDFKALKPFRYMKDTFIFFLPQIATTIYTVLDRTMLGLFDADKIENGYYEQAYKMIQVSLSIVTSINTVMGPRIAYLYAKNDIKLIKEKLRKSMRFVNLTALPLVFGLMATASFIVPWFFGDGYEKVSEILPIFAPIIFIIALSNCLGSQCLSPCGMRLKSALVLWLGAGLNLVCNLILIPKIYSAGAVVGSIVAESTITVFYFVIARKYVSFGVTVKDALKYVIASVLMFAAVLFVKGMLTATVMNTAILVVVGAVVYGLALLVMRDKLVLEYIDIAKQKVFKR